MDDQTAGTTSRPTTSRLVVDVVRAVRGWVLAAAGGVLILGCYLGVSNESEVYRQIPYLVSGGFFGMALVIIGAALLVADKFEAGQSSGRTAAQVEDLHSLIVAGTTPDPASYYFYAQTPAQPPADALSKPGAEPASGTPTQAGLDDTALYAVPTGRTFHRASCELLVGKAAAPVDASAVTARALSPCSICTPSVTNV